MSLSELMSHARLSAWAEAALVLFMAAFVMVALRLLLGTDARELGRRARLPLDEDATPPAPPEKPHG